MVTWVLFELSVLDNISAELSFAELFQLGLISRISNVRLCAMCGWFLLV